MTERYFVAEPITSNRVIIAGPEAHHLLHVMRARVGTQVVLFDGGGDEFQATVSRIGTRVVELQIVARLQISRELPFQLMIAAPLPKGDRQKWLIEKAVELGVTRFIPLITKRTIVRPSHDALVRLKRTVIEASKQCGRNRLMEITPPQGWADVVSTAHEYAWRLTAHPFRKTGVLPDVNLWAALGKFPSCPNVAESLKTIAAVGPEGGLDDEELTTATTAGWQLVDLGPRVLRTETAALLLVALIICRHNTLTTNAAL